MGCNEVILLDTHVLLWLRSGNENIGKNALSSIEEAYRQSKLYISAISFWEIALLKEKGRITLAHQVSAWRKSVIAEGITEIPVDGEIGIRSNQLSGFHPDPADRIITTTAMLSGIRLYTADEKILNWDSQDFVIDVRY
jgi:PIN domain nuclease of toxin-antitoxin system